MNPQIGRIKKKLLQAKQVDKNCSVFGAAAHNYKIHPPATVAQVEAFKKTYGIQLPNSYRTFVLYVGNGGISFLNSGAGPYYGIYPLGDHLNQLVNDDPTAFLGKDCCLSPKMTNTEWQNLTEILEDDTISSKDYYDTFSKIYGGILPLGSQGCTCIHALVLNGPHADRVVNLEMAADQKPIFAPDATFLDWYERWLDEIISGKLIQQSPSWFGYSSKEEK